jgi:glycosyltransferase involved in cell wall biosynthesis
LPLDVLIVSGIWPPAVGGPASHAPEVAAYLRSAGHTVSVVTSSTGPVEPAGHPLRVLRQDRPLPLRLAQGAGALTRAARSVDVVYSTGFYSRAAIACSASQTPLVAKLVNDPAYERARSLGLFDGTLEAFQRPTTDRRITALKRLRTWSVARCRTVIVPSRYLGAIVEGWSQPAPAPTVIHNPRPEVGPPPDRSALREELGLVRPTAVFAGRIVPQKDLGVALAAVARADGLDLVVLGDGPGRAALERDVADRGLTDRVRLLGARPRADVLRWLAAADLALLSSAWENYPHGLVEALAVGTPVVATAVGGVPEIVEDGVTGLLVAPGDPAALAAALRRWAGEPGLAGRLRRAAGERPAGVSEAEAFGALETLLRAAAR